MSGDQPTRQLFAYKSLIIAFSFHTETKSTAKNPQNVNIVKSPVSDTQTDDGIITAIETKITITTKVMIRKNTVAASIHRLVTVIDIITSHLREDKVVL